MFQLEDCIGFITSKNAKILADEFNKRLSEHGTTRVQWIALYYIGNNEYITQKELSDLMDIKESTMVRLIDRLEKEDLVKRVKDIKDRRITKLTLTDKGANFREKLLPLGEEFSDSATEGISQDDLDIFKKVLEKMIKNINT